MKEYEMNILGSLCLLYGCAIFIGTAISNYKLGLDVGLPNTFGYMIIAAAICFK